MLQSMIQEVHLLPGLPKTKRERDYRYLMELREEKSAVSVLYGGGAERQAEL